MRITWSPFDNSLPDKRPGEAFAHDILARELAEKAGVNWEELNNYPGYGKNIWREVAECLMKRASARKPRWN